MTHFVRFEDEGDEELWWYIEHPAECPERVIYEHPANPDESVIGRDCVYEWETDNIGREAFVSQEDHSLGLPTEPGRYIIEWVNNGEKGDWFESWIEVGRKVSDDGNP